MSQTTRRSSNAVSRRQMIQTAVAATVFAGVLERPFRRIDAAQGSPQGLALCIGLNHVDADEYGGWDGKLDGCINDARAMKELARKIGYYDQQTLIDSEATIDEVRRHILWAAHELQDGDTFLLSCSSHGGQCRDTDNDEDGDGLDETWCLYDGQWVDDDRRKLFKQFSSKVRIIVVGDMCHSGTSTRAMMTTIQNVRHAPNLHSELDKDERNKPRNRGGVPTFSHSGSREFRDSTHASDDSAAVARDLETYMKGLAKITRDYQSGKLKGKALGRELSNVSGRRRVRAMPEVLVDELSSDVRRSFRSSRLRAEHEHAPAILLAACQDSQTALDGTTHGLFTEAILNVWDNGRFNGSYALFFRTVRDRLSTYFGHTPNLDKFGGSGTTELLQKAAFRLNS